MLVRREVLAGSAAAAITGAPALWFPPQRSKGRSLAVFLYDSRFAQNVAMAGDWSRQATAIVDTQGCDLGQCWRRDIPDMLASGGGIAGITLWSDQYICEQFGRDYGLKPQSFTPLAHGLHSWLLS